ncbi:penicillin-binding protein 2 [Streptacidiphilus sp. ASG 303]|uniref:peptidoglycan D,D-transpeptidase FtsI family protein n=1 Tax=Streptacidiphilus sp. ASG 303 TaxID=2896847 RepID=UPI001E63CE3D|nr:penicillin-binding protein 2 [Streptacidiphilus sp. ASG 303]MCD0481634.1 penicillin-binding protein 2 [Streptacidiphilus sp. ASG 303]
MTDEPRRPRRPAAARPAPAPRPAGGRPAAGAAAPRPPRPRTGRPDRGQDRERQQDRERPQDREGRPGRPARPGRPPAARGSAGKAIRLGDPRRRLRVVTAVLAAVLALFVGRLVQLQLVDASALAGEAAVNRYVDDVLPADRGAITDASGAVLAATVDADDITADPTMFTPAQTKVPDAPQQAAALLAPILGTDRAKLAAALSAPGKRYALLAGRQPPQAWTQISALKAAFAKQAATPACQAQAAQVGRPADQGGRTSVDAGCADVLAGVFHRGTSRRVYPDGGLASNVVGFVNGEGLGAGGLEQQYQAELAGRDGRITYAQSGGQLVPTAGFHERAAVPGSTLRLTLDRDIQWAAQRAITDQVRAAGAEKGYVIVQDVRSGQVLAMATAPGFNAGDLAHAAPGALGNPALQDAYEPGSTAKLMTMAAVLDTGTAAWDTHVTVPGTLHRADRIFHDDVDHGTWYLTLNGVLAKSSNIGTIEAAEHLGKTQKESNRVLEGYLRKFGIGRPTGLGFPGETRGILAAAADWQGSQQYTIPFGQGLSLNALQATSVYSTIANGGVRVDPSLVRGTTGPDGRFTPAPAPGRTRVVGPQTAGTLARMLESVVSDEQGTGARAQIPGYRVAGKTGTANRVDPRTGRYSGYTASFIGFAPADRPRLTVSCTIQDPVNGHFGGQLCGPVFKQVMEFALKSLQVPPSGAPAPGLPVEWKPSP